MKRQSLGVLLVGLQHRPSPHEPCSAHPTGWNPPSASLPLQAPGEEVGGVCQMDYDKWNE